MISTGLHDPLKAKALVLVQGEVKAALVVCDLLSVPEPLSTQARKQAGERTGIPFTNIIIAATHNHGSPEYWGRCVTSFTRKPSPQRGGMNTRPWITKSCS